MSKSKLINIYKTIIDKWKQNRCIGNVILQAPLNPNEVIASILQQTYAKDSTSKVMIVVKDYKAREELTYGILHSCDEDNNVEFKKLLDAKHLRIYTHDFLTNWNYRDKFKICIVSGINDYTSNIEKVFEQSIFKLVILTNQIDNASKRDALNKVCPVINGFTNSELSAINLSSPVEEIREAITITNEEELTLLKQYDEYVTQSMSIFGSFDVMYNARSGDKNLNISAVSIREQLAATNGWHRGLDMSVEFNRHIDEAFNPNCILERSETTFDIIRSRNMLLTDNTAKLEKILAICLENKGKRILIINKRSEFASIVTEYINANIPSTGKTEIEGAIFNTDKPVLRTHPICVNYHDKVDKVPAWDVYGKPILVKSGNDKGSQKLIGAVAQKRESERLFNEGYVTILSTNNSPATSLKCVIDLMIITSPMCDTIKELKYRLSGVQFDSLPNRVIKLYCNSTVEERNLNKETPSPFHTIVNNMQINSSYNENSGSIVVG